MKSQDMSKSLRAFARLLDGRRGEEMARFATVFEGGKAEPVAARVKRILASWKRDNVQPNAPAGLKRDLAAVEAGLAASGAKSQAKVVQIALSLFNGREGGHANTFVAQVVEARDAAIAKAEKPALQPDQELARRLTDELTIAVLDEAAFAKIVKRLDDKKMVSTMTLALIANRFLGNSRVYKNRKPAMTDILQRHKDDLRSYARGKALDRIGV